MKHDDEQNEEVGSDHQADLFDADHLQADGALRDAVVDLRGQIDKLPQPEFQAPSGRSPMLAVAAALLLVFGGVFAFTRNADEGPDIVGTATETPTAEQTPVEEPIAEPTDITPDPVLEPGPYVTDTSPRDLEPLAQPAPGASVLDPAFGQVITRITDAGPGGVISPQAPNPWNADESLLLLYGRGGDFQLYDSETFEQLGSVDISPADLEQVYWSPTNPTLLHVVEGIDLVAIDVAELTGGRFVSDQPARQVLHTFANCDDVSSGKAAVPTSTDGQLFGLVCSLGEQETAVAFHLADGELGRSDIPLSMGPIPLPDGTGFLMIQDDETAQLTDRSLNPTGDPYPMSLDVGVLVPSDLGTLAVGVNFSDRSGTVVALSVDGATSIVAVGEAAGWPYPPTGNSYGGTPTNSGAVIVGIAGEFPTEGTTLLDGEILLANASTEEPSAVRLAHHRNAGTYEDSAWSQPFVAISPSGTKVVFSSDWGTDEVNTYFISLANPL